jgi:mannan endo-1,4-beta-mannosidase
MQYRSFPWIRVSKASPYFETDLGEPWTPVGHNDSITWPALRALYGRQDPAAVESYLEMLARRSVTVLRLMLEYSEGDDRYLEEPAGRFNPRMIRLWDDLFSLCGKHGLRILATPFDTFWMWNRWDRHPYNKLNGGPCDDRARLLLCPETRKFMKARLEFASGRWGGSGALFAWDLYNEIHPSHAGDSAGCFPEFIEDLSTALRSFEDRRYGRAHPQTVSVFGPHMILDSRIKDCIFRHPCLDFASTHFYEEGTIDFPRNTVDAAIATGRIMREALAEAPDQRPFFDSEHGPIHTYKDHRITLPEPFDDEYFRHMQWAHFASGGAGGGMRWPNRAVHILTKGMHVAQRNLSRFLPLIDWRRFRRRNLNQEIGVEGGPLASFACASEDQAVAWLLRTDSIGSDGRLNRRATPVPARIRLPRMREGCYEVTAWDTAIGAPRAQFRLAHGGGGLCIDTPGIVRDVALAVRCVG